MEVLVLLSTVLVKQNNVSDLVNEAIDVLRFIVLESLKETCRTKLFPFLIKKVISTKPTPTTVKKTGNSNLLAGVDSWKHSENILKVILNT